MRGRKLIIAMMVTGVVAVAGGAAPADNVILPGVIEQYSADLSGFYELGALNNQTGAVLSNATGTAYLLLDKQFSTITYTLTYANVGTTAPGTGTVSQAHIHFGKSRDSGGVLVYFCTNLTFTGHTGPTPPSCPLNGGTVSGTWTGANVQAIRSQNVNAGDFNALVGALESNTAYANVHSTSGTTPDTAFPAGEIRGQVRMTNTANQN